MAFFCFLLVVFGLIICFGGIYIKKFCSFTMGMVWGALLAVVLIVVSNESIWSVDREESMGWIILCAIAVAIFSTIHEKVCAFLNVAVPVFFFVSILTILNESFPGGDDLVAICWVSLLVAIIFGWVACVLYAVCYMLETAFTGAFIACLGVYGLVHEVRDFGDLVFDALRDDEIIALLCVGTIALGIVGFCVQWHRFVAIKEEKSHPDTVNWRCKCCGHSNPAETAFCSECGTQRVALHHSPSVWTCECGTENEAETTFCSQCGKKCAATGPATGWVCPNCGAENEADYVFCMNCKTKAEGK